MPPRYIHNFAFNNLPNVTSIELSNNILETLQPAVFEANTRLFSLELGSNRWNCDCGLRAFATWMSNRFDKVGDAVLLCWLKWVAAVIN